MRRQFTFYESFWRAIDKISEPAERLAAFEALCRYALEEVEPAAPLPEAAAVAFELIRPVLRVAHVRAERGREGGKKRRYVNKSGSNEQKAIKENEKEKEKEVEVEVEVEVEKEKDTYSLSPTSVGEGTPPPPTVKEIADHVRETGYGFDPYAFFAYYDSQNWRKANGQPVTDWKAACAYWAKTERRFSHGKPDQAAAVTAEKEAMNQPSQAALDKLDRLRQRMNA